MEKRILLKSQLNDIFKYIDIARLNHCDFTWTYDKNSVEIYLEVPKLIHQPTMYYFKFDKKGESLVSVYFPNESGSVYTNYWSTWDAQFNDFIMRIDILKNELSVPNFWESYLAASTIFEVKFDIDNELFKIDEQKFISEKLLEIEKYLNERENLTEENITSIKNKITYLAERSMHLGKKDWLNILIGVSLKIAFDIALSAEAAKEFFKFVGNAFSHIWGGPILLP